MLFPAKYIGPCTDRAQSMWLYNCISSAQERKGNAEETLRPKRSKSIYTRTSKAPQRYTHRILPTPVHTSEAFAPPRPAPPPRHRREGLPEPTPWVRRGARPRGDQVPTHAPSRAAAHLTMEEFRARFLPPRDPAEHALAIVVLGLRWLCGDLSGFRWRTRRFCSRPIVGICLRATVLPLRCHPTCPLQPREPRLLGTAEPEQNPPPAPPRFCLEASPLAWRWAEQSRAHALIQADATGTATRS